MRRLYALTTILALTAAPEAIWAQQVTPAGVVAVHRAESAKGLPIARPLPHALVADSAQAHPWYWIGSGAVLGAATGGIVAAVAVSRTNDAISGLAGPAIGIAAVAGGVVGGLLGGLFYLISH